MEIFGPVQSRRLGLSLGINHLPPKVCSYACVYCQLGRTNRLSIEPAAYADPEQIYRAIQERLKELPQAPDYLTFVSNGEPCLDSQLGDAIQALKKLGIKIAVITNASLLWQSEIRESLSYADAVSLKVDSVQEVIWRKINRPHGRLDLELVMAGMRVFALTYPGKLLTETMLVPNINTSPSHLRACAQFVSELQPEMAYLALPLRSPAESWVEAPDQQATRQAYEIFEREFARTSLMADLPPTGLTSTQDALQELLSTLKVHPMEQGEIHAYLRRNELSNNTLENLLAQKRIRSILYREKTFYSAAINQD